MKKFLTDIELIDAVIRNCRVENVTEINYTTPTSGLIYFDTSSNFLRYYNGTSWVDIKTVVLDTDDTTHIVINDNIKVNLADQAGVTAGTYGSSDTTLTSSSRTFKIAQVTIDGKGIVTSVANRTITIPQTLANPNALTVKANGTQQFAYSGSSAATVDIVGSNHISVSGNTSTNTITITDNITTGSSSTLGLLKVDGTTITASSGTISVVNAKHTHTSANITDKATTIASGSSAVPTSDAVYQAIEAAKTEVLETNGAMLYKGTVGTGGDLTTLPTTYNKGWTYVVCTAGTYAGQTCEIGDMIIAKVDRATAAASGVNTDAEWNVIQTNINGAVTGPSSVTTNTVAIFDGTTGKVIKSSGYTIGKSVPSNAVFTDTYVSSGAWTAGSSAGPTLTLTRNSGSVSIAAIPSASLTASGVVTNGAQSFGGAKTFAGQVNFANGSTYNVSTAGKGTFNGVNAGALTATTGTFSGAITGSGSGISDINASNISTGTLSADRLATSGVTAGTYGPTANATPAFGATFTVPKVVVDNKGRVTSAANYTVTIPTQQSLAAYPKKAVLAVPATNADTPVTITHNLGISAKSINNTNIYGCVVQVYNLSTNEQVVCDVKNVDTNSCKLTFSQDIAANTHYVVIVG